MKTCTKCNSEKQITEFSKEKLARDGLKSICRKCASIAALAWQKENHEKRLASSRSWAKANPDKILAKSRDYYSANKDKVKASVRLWQVENPTRKPEIDRAYRKANPDKMSAKSRNRRALKAGSSGSHTAAEVKSIFEYQRGMCATCGKRLFNSGKNKFHVDHIMPLACAGSDDKYNLQCLCPECNLRKAAKDPLDWAKENGKLL